ncbi:MAG: hypothetical protein JSW26_27290 [Desulfobacterales bacterium]|nr:MAG: hypothetical protein JSW26_27290 [Desulfobacterales bacterium]
MPIEVQTDTGFRSDVNRKTDKALLNYIKNTLRATRPWTRLLAVLGFIVTAITILSGIAMFIGSNVFPAVAGAPPPRFTGMITIATSVFYLVPSIWLFKYSSAITRFLGGGGAIELANALVYQKSFWKFIGTTTLVSLILAVFGILAAVFIPMLLFLRS